MRTLGWARLKMVCQDGLLHEKRRDKELTRICNMYLLRILELSGDYEFEHRESNPTDALRNMSLDLCNIASDANHDCKITLYVELDHRKHNSV